MKDGLIRSSIKAVARACFYTNVGITRLIWRARGEKPFELGGECRKCAACCETPSIQVGRLVWYFPMLRRLFLAWHKHVNGFELADRIPSGRIFVFKCTHFDWETRRCDSYASRPGMCRDYPRALMWQARPEMLPPCGYRPVDPNAEPMIAALRKEGVDEEKLEEVKKKLYLE